MISIMNSWKALLDHSWERPSGSSASDPAWQARKVIIVTLTTIMGLTRESRAGAVRATYGNPSSASRAPRGPRFGARGC